MPWPIGRQPNNDADVPAAPYRRGMPLRRRLLISSLLGVIPLLLLGGILLYGWYNTSKTSILQSNFEQGAASRHIRGGMGDRADQYITNFRDL